MGPSVSGLFQGLPHYGPGEKVIDNTYYGQIKSFFSLATNSRLLSQRAHDTDVQGYRVFTGKSHNTHNGIILKYLSGKPATFFLIIHPAEILVMHLEHVNGFSRN